MNHLKITVLDQTQRSPWHTEEQQKTCEGETTIPEVIILERGMKSGLPSVAFKIMTPTGWMFAQMTYGNLEGLAGAAKGVAIRTGALPQEGQKL